MSSYFFMMSTIPCVGKMKAHEVFLVQTQKIINTLYIFVIIILPLVIFGDGKKTMALLFTRIRLPVLERQTSLSQNIQILFIVLGFGIFYCHRRWRLYLHDRKHNNLIREIHFLDGNELIDVKEKLWKSINKVIEEKRIRT